MRLLDLHTILSIDFDAHAAATYRANFPGVEVRCGKVEDQVATLPAADVVIGGPPCQSFSLAGAGLGEFDPRNGWPAAVASVAKVMPRQFLFENVAGMLTSKHIVYLRKVFTALERMGYHVEIRKLDSVNYGVPQFRDRIWLWGIRNDIKARHCWPAPTHAWPWPEPGMFGDHGLQRAVTVGWALDIPHRQADGEWFGGAGSDGVIHRRRVATQDRPDHPFREPAPTIDAGADRKYHVVYDHGLAELSSACPTIKAGGNVDASGHQGGACPPAIKVMGAGRHDVQPKTIREITGEPSQTIVGQWQGHQQPEVHEYHWSDKMLTKHPPASPASPAATVQAKWFKGGAEGLVEIVDDPKHQPHQPANSLTSGGNGHGPTGNTLKVAVVDHPRSDGRTWQEARKPAEPAEPAGTVRARSPRDGGRCTENVVRITKKLVRRLTPVECAHLMSMPDDFKWPEKISKTAMYRIIGNGQCSLMAHHMAQALAKADPASKTVISLFCGGGVGDVGFHGRYWEFSTSRQTAAPPETICE